MKTTIWKKLLTQLSPILGAGAVGVCPFCWVGSASLLTYLGLGALISAWLWVVAIFVLLGLVGFAFDYKAHKNIRPLALLIVGALLLYVGRYVLVGTGFGYWPIWGSGAALIVTAVVLNKKEFKKTKVDEKN
ncbi:MAG: MerC domain-containing protein [Candidatus Pacebacteria bacterium]|nr:MerC domain-containing protein [Candidatus Paceibacterota bacterium]